MPWRARSRGVARCHRARRASSRRWRSVGIVLDRRAGPPRVASVAMMVSSEPLDILVVDDESELREQIRRLFERDGHRVLAVADGRAAIDRASTDRFDIVLLDVALGAGPNGYDVCRILRERRNVVPIIMLTALDSE